MRTAFLTALTTPVLLLAACNGDPIVNQNAAPVASVGDDIEQPANLNVFLDGRTSYDEDGDELTFFWSIDHAPEASELADRANPFTPNRGSDASTTSFQPDAQGVYVVELVVFDGLVYSDPVYNIVTAGDPTEAPVAIAGNDQTLAFGETASLDGGQSQDPLGGLLQYDWFLVDKPYNSDLNRDSVTSGDQKSASFTADVPGDYGIALIVCSRQACSEADKLTLSFEGDNQPPVADAGGDFDAEDCLSVSLDCGGSDDPDNDLLFYWWTIQGVPEGSDVDNRFITNQNAADPDVFFDIAGEYKLSCSVFDGKAWSRPDTITVDVAERSFNENPVVDLGDDIFVDYGITDGEQERPNAWSPLITTCDKVGEGVPPVEIDPVVTDADGDGFTVFWEVIRDSKARLLSRPESMLGIIKTPNMAPDKLGITQDVSFVQMTATDCTGGKGKDEVEIVTQVDCVLK